jgi:hypothetical protein
VVRRADRLTIRVRTLRGHLRALKLASKDVPLGNGTLLWFEVSDTDGAVRRAREIEAQV